MSNARKPLIAGVRSITTTPKKATAMFGIESVDHDIRLDGSDSKSRKRGGGGWGDHGCAMVPNLSRHLDTSLGTIHIGRLPPPVGMWY